jgi:hypothetical protein
MAAPTPNPAQQNYANTPLEALQLEDFSTMESRYHGLGLCRRAQTVLADADVALRTADRLLAQLGAHPQLAQAFANIRANAALIGKMRPSEARNILMDPTVDFIDVARHKLAVWRKTMERIAQGEGVMSDHQKKEYISGQIPLAMAIASASSASVFLSVLQLVFGELARLDTASAMKCQIEASKVRRCATFLSDCECAAGFRDAVH